MMKQFTILVDMDDTIENFCEEWISTLNMKYNLDVKYSDITDWNISKFYPSLSKSELYEPLSTERFWRRVVPFRDAQHYLPKLMEDGHKIYIVTASHHDTVAYKLNHVLFKYFPYFTYKDVIICSDKQMIRGDFLIDDGAHNLTGGEYKGILMDRFHNRSFDNEFYRIPRVKNWGQIYSLIKEYAEE